MSNYRRSPLIQEGLEIPCNVTVIMPTVINKKIIEKLEELLDILDIEPDATQLSDPFFTLQENESFNLQVVKINLTSISLQYFLTMWLSLSLTVSEYLPIKVYLKYLMSIYLGNNIFRKVVATQNLRSRSKETHVLVIRKVLSTRVLMSPILYCIGIKMLTYEKLKGWLSDHYSQ